MPEYSVVFYSIDPSGIFSSHSGGSGVYSGPAMAEGHAQIVDEGSVPGQLTVGSFGPWRVETARATVSHNGAVSENSALHVSEAWSLHDATSGEAFRVFRLEVEEGGARGSYLLSERPLVPGRSYETRVHDEQPLPGKMAFDYSAQSGFAAPAEAVIGAGGIHGTNDDDASIAGTGGDDRIFGGAGTGEEKTGNDSIDAGAGEDVVTAGDGDDRIAAGAGADTVFAGAGDDSVLGQGGDDTLHGGAGDDVIDAGLGSDTVFGGEGDDLLYGSADTGDAPEEIAKVVENFTFDTGKKSAVTPGGGEGAIGDSILYRDIGVAHDGTMISARVTVTGMSNTGLDVTLGISSNYPLYLNRAGNRSMEGETVDFRVEFLDADGQPVTVDSSFTFRDVDNSRFSGAERITIQKSDVAGYALSEDPPSDITVTEDETTMTFGSTVSGNSADENLWAEIVFRGQSSLDFTVTSRGAGTGYGFDSANFAEDATVREVSMTIDDALFGGAGDDTLHGQGGRDTLDGGSGDDEIEGGLGDDTISGGTGDDTIRIRNVDGHDSIDGGDGDDKLNFDYKDTAEGVSVSFGSDTGGTYAFGSASGAYDGIEIITTTALSDTVDGSATGSGVTILTAGGDDTLIGGSGADKLFGGAGDDMISGGAGDDTLSGGDGADTYLLAPADLSDLGTEEEIEAALLDLNLTGMTGWQAAKGHHPGQGKGLENKSSEIDIGSIADQAGDAVQPLVGTRASKEIGETVETTIETQLAETPGSEISSAEIGASVYDALVSDYGAIVAGLASTTTVLGIDEVLGAEPEPGSEALREEILARASHDTITDFEIGRDVLDLSGHDYLGTGGLSTNDVKVTDTAGDGSGDAVLTFPDGSTLTLGGISAPSLDPATLETMGLEASDDATGFQNEFLGLARVKSGGGGHDSILGSAAAETLSGDEGNDYIAAMGGADTVFGGAGDDRIVLSDDLDGLSVDGGDGLDSVDFSGLGSGVSISSSGGEAGVFAVLPDASGGVGALQQGVGQAWGAMGATSASAVPQTATVAYGGDFSGVESLSGTEHDDKMDFSAHGVGVDAEGLGGGDRIAGSAHDDTLSGGAGWDDLRGNAGNDTLDGGAGEDRLAGGAGDDVLTGGDGSDVFVLSARGGSDRITDFETPPVDGSFGDRLDSSALSDLGNTLTNQDGTVTANEVKVAGGGGSDQVLIFPGGERVSVPDGTVDTSSSKAQFASLVAIGVPPCFLPGTLIETGRGPVPVEALRLGDLLVTADHGLQALRWIGRRTQPLSGAEARHRPIEFRPGSLGASGPRRTLRVSPQHRIMLTGTPPGEGEVAREVLAPAKALTDLPGVRVMHGRNEAVYFALLLDRHEIIFADGAPTESFRPGPVALAGLDRPAREAIFAIYPLLRLASEGGLGPAARPILGVRAARAFCRDEMREGWRLPGMPRAVTCVFHPAQAAVRS